MNPDGTFTWARKTHCVPVGFAMPSRYWRLEDGVSLPATMTESLPEKTEVFTQASKVRALVGLRDAELETDINCAPLKLKAWPTSPAAKPVPFNRPLLLSALSEAFPSARHQLINPAGVEV